MTRTATAMHPDDEFHPPLDGDHERTETCWFTFTVPEHRISGQLYPFFRPNQKVMAGGVYFWDEHGDQHWNCLYAKNFWHLPLPGQPLSNIVCPNGIRIRCLEPLTRYEVGYSDPDGNDEIEVQLTFTAIAKPHYLGKGHLDQPGRYQGRIVLHGREYPVDSFGFRDRSWGQRSQFGRGLVPKGPTRGGYTYATASANDAFHTITAWRGGHFESYHGYLIRDGEWSKLASGRREVLERDKATGYPTRVRFTGVDELGRKLNAEGRCLNKLGVPLNPNMLSINCLTEWEFDGVSGYGEDHENWTPAEGRKFFREFLGYSK
ncbi:MAG: hypothetical protein IPM80_17830 [Proteobacteria bacterium]|nr:hypothetical protein [Pseudomonadota bacterium]